MGKVAAGIKPIKTESEGFRSIFGCEARPLLRWGSTSGRASDLSPSVVSV